MSGQLPFRRGRAATVSARPDNFRQFGPVGLVRGQGPPPPSSQLSGLDQSGRPLYRYHTGFQHLSNPSSTFDHTYRGTTSDGRPLQQHHQPLGEIDPVDLSLRFNSTLELQEHAVTGSTVGAVDCGPFRTANPVRYSVDKPVSGFMALDLAVNLGARPRTADLSVTRTMVDPSTVGYIGSAGTAAATTTGAAAASTATATAAGRGPGSGLVFSPNSIQTGNRNFRFTATSDHYSAESATGSRFSTSTLPSPTSPADPSWTDGFTFAGPIGPVKFEPSTPICPVKLEPSTPFGFRQSDSPFCCHGHDGLATGKDRSIGMPDGLMLPPAVDGGDLDFDPAVNTWDIDPISLFDLDIPTAAGPDPNHALGRSYGISSRTGSTTDEFIPTQFQDLSAAAAANCFSNPSSISGDVVGLGGPGGGQQGPIIAYTPLPIRIPITMAPSPLGQSAAGVQKSYKGFRIPNDKKQKLETYFKVQPYPTAEQLFNLSVETGLHLDTVRNWFSNTRTRRMRADKNNAAKAMIRVPSRTSSHASASTSVGPSTQTGQSTGICSSVSVGSASIHTNTAVSTPSLGPVRPPTSSIKGKMTAPATSVPAVSLVIPPAPPPLQCPALKVSKRKSEDDNDGHFLRRFLSIPLSEDPRATTILSGGLTDPLDSPVTRSSSRAGFEPYSVREAIYQHRANGATGSSGGTNGVVQTVFAADRTTGFSSGTATPGSVISAKRSSRRGRRRHTQPGPFSYALDPIKVVRFLKRYYCTYCGRSFANRYEWNRHEESVHVPQKLWICCPSSKIDLQKRLSRCPMCPVECPSVDHLSSHNLFECAGKPPEHRTFTRRDHFIQHIQQTHRKDCKSRELLLQEIGDTPDLWIFPVSNTSIDSLNLTCGFCGKQSSSWSERVSHIADHFRHGTDLSDWWLGRKKLSTDYPLSYHVTVTPNNPALSTGSTAIFDRRLSGPRRGNLVGASGSTGPDGGRWCRCRTCNTRFDSVESGRAKHPACHFYSCAHLLGLRSAFDMSDPRQCLYCPYVTTTSDDWTDRLLHVVHTHRFRECDQDVFFSVDAFIHHLVTDHKACFSGSTEQSPIGVMGDDGIESFDRILDERVDRMSGDSGLITLMPPPPRVMGMCSRTDSSSSPPDMLDEPIILTGEPIKIKNRAQVIAGLCRQAIRPQFEPVDSAEPTGGPEPPLIFRTYSPPRLVGRTGVYGTHQSSRLSSRTGSLQGSEIGMVEYDGSTSSGPTCQAPVYGPHPFPRTDHITTGMFSFPPPVDMSMAPPPYQQSIGSTTSAAAVAAATGMVMAPPPPYGSVHMHSNYTSPGGSAGPNSPRLGPFRLFHSGTAHGGSGTAHAHGNIEKQLRQAVADLFTGAESG